MLPNVPSMGGLDLTTWQIKKPMAIKHMVIFHLFKKDI
jgi:hypothetical protein